MLSGRGKGGGGGGGGEGESAEAREAPAKRGAETMGKKEEKGEMKGSKDFVRNSIITKVLVLDVRNSMALE